MKLKTRELVLAAMLSALLIAAKQAMSFIPNFEPVTLLLILYTLHFPRMTPLIIYVFVAVQVLLYGFNVWVYMYLYIWIILYAVVRLLARWGSYLCGLSLPRCTGCSLACFARRSIFSSAVGIWRCHGLFPVSRLISCTGSAMPSWWRCCLSRWISYLPA